jgi:DNA-binding CsgD family transcriptional regulator
VATPALLVAGPTATLTRREREIATLAARGATDRQIADELIVSIRTVQSHLYNAYAKLGVDGRAGLVDLLGA